MTPSELHTAVMASPGRLDGETLAWLDCLVRGNRFENFITDQFGGILVECTSPERQLLNSGYKWHDRPDTNIGAALGLVKVKFPKAIWSLHQSTHDEIAFILVPPDKNGMVAHHKDPCLAIIAALLKAMGA